MLSIPCSLFSGYQKILAAPAVEVGLFMINQHELGQSEPILCFNDQTGRLFDFDFTQGKKGLIDDLLKRGAAIDSQRQSTVFSTVDDEVSEDSVPRGRGRPKLGVVSKEVTLLPRHWDWLNAQPAGASATLRKLVEHARKSSGVQSKNQQAIEASYHFIHAIAGDLPDFEAATRALFANDLAQFQQVIQDWPQDIQAYAVQLATTV